jgi:hypothetical protein
MCEGHSKNARTRGLTLVALIFPLRNVPGVVNADSASESSEISSEHHCMGANHPEQKESQVTATTTPEGRLIKP